MTFPKPLVSLRANNVKKSTPNLDHPRISLPCHAITTKRPPSSPGSQPLFPTHNRNCTQATLLSKLTPCQFQDPTFTSAPHFKSYFHPSGSQYAHTTPSLAHVLLSSTFSQSWLKHDHRRFYFPLFSLPNVEHSEQRISQERPS